MHPSCRPTAAIVLWAWPLAALAAFAWESYAPATLAQIAAIHGEVRDVDRVINTAEEKYRVRVIYLGERRPLPEPTRALIADWVQATGADDRVPAWFKHEIRVAEEDRPHWLPIQEVLLPHIEQELAAGNAVDLYLMWIGYVERRWVFLVNEFQKPNAR